MKTVVAALLGTTLLGCGPPLYRDIDSLQDVRAAFNADEGRARLLLLLSPT